MILALYIVIGLFPSQPNGAIEQPIGYPYGSMEACREEADRYGVDPKWRERGFESFRCARFVPSPGEECFCHACKSREEVKP